MSLDRLLFRTLLLAGLGLAAVASCTYDFDEAFEQSGVGASGGAGGGTGGGTGGVGISDEDCGNGQDDDGDGDTDCEDEDCATYTCAELPPPDWTGPVAFFLGTATDTMPECGLPWDDELDVYLGLDAAPAECAACSCGDPTIDCGLPSTGLYAAGGCDPQNRVASLTPSAPGLCETVTVDQVVNAVGGDTAPDPIVSCPPAGGEAAVEPHAWSQHGRICLGASPGAGCAGTQVCAPAPTGVFRLCVVREGDHPCPGVYTAKDVLHAGLDDSRGCTACACTPAGGDCDASTTVWRNDSCDWWPFETVHHGGGDCDWTSNPWSAPFDASFRYDTNPSADPCEVSGGEVDGEAAPTGTRTVCCLP